MKKAGRRVKKYRHYDEGFKKGIVKEYESGEFSVLELSRLYGIGYRLIYNWIYKYSIFNEKGYRIVESKESSQQKLKALESRLQELESLLGRKQIKIEYLEKLIELASEELAVDLKKNYGSRPWNGLDSEKGA